MDIGEILGDEEAYLAELLAPVAQLAGFKQVRGQRAPG